ncbi:NAD-dependent succinate-semialdehyde dehydrogenase [Pseudogemmobacter faecipullorum]|uniref:NAD-dependent succinate-semialdehyde dehydrogenase n=1 Tax=Pseudogemmobacter faecipullorum TaxID=2755041 RepID=A0ABS8CJE1_9RHOB|nr:NAD-dependent succinate-semialdehyde dehydrogenase [Pseudogemmobacter faecipullorum]MCB5408980.1 NAD-dependent succinate-semialdehyde dehydrogenase [Pseudogemmobacter faecipullorum]
MTAYPDTLLFIDGSWKEAVGGRSIAVINPATGAQIGSVAHASREDLDAALAAVEKGFAVWKNTPAYERGKLMRKAADLLRARADEIAVMMTLENGKPLAQSKMEIGGAADVIDWFAAEGQRSYGQMIPSRAPDVLQITVKQPVGPVAAFTPWNFPINQVVRKLSAALAAGCSIIVKAPEETPASPAALIRAFADAGIPAGVVNLVYGIPAEISEYLIPHPVIRKISFTGSTPVGKQLAALAGLHMKRATMELGGHAPVIVAGDADIAAAASQIAMHKFRNAGQVCVSPTRFLVQEEKHEEFTARFTEYAAALKVGDGMDPETAMGPLSNERRIPALEALVQDAVDKGARLTTGGRRLGNEGWFFAPTVLADVPLNARIMNEEPFGPVAVINKFSTLDEAITEANRLPFGLAAYAYTTDTATATRLGYEIEAGMLTINHLGLALPEVPFGGMKDSGYGTEGGSEAIEAYLETRFVTRKG